MAELRCPNCGRKNSDLLDVCQFCQTPLKPDSVLHIGQTPTKKDTGELESVLPSWLKNVRQQARDSAEEDTPQTAGQSRAEKEETPDLLAGLASQSGEAGDDEIPDWLASIGPAGGPKPAAPAAPEPESDFFARFRQSEAAPASKPPREEVPASPAHRVDQSPDSAGEDELSKWFAQAAEQPEEVVDIDSNEGRPAEPAWPSSFDSPLPSQPEPAAREPEDLSWLHNLEATAKETGDLQAPKPGADWMSGSETPSEPSRSPEDLSWLDDLSGIEGSAQLTPEQPSKPGDDMDWLKNLGTPATPQPFDAAPDQPVSVPPFTSDEDLSWLNDLGRTSEPSSPAEAASAIPSSAQEDLSWLNDLSGAAGTPSAPPFLEEESAGPDVAQPAAPFVKEEMEPPDWLKSAMAESSTPPAADLSLDWLTRTDQPVDQTPPAVAGPSTPEPPPFSDIFSAPAEPSLPTSQEVDSLFSVEMPDWLAHAEPSAGEPASEQPTLPPAGGDESLAPVDLPSWVQAMRPMEAVISEAATSTADEPEETQGPLAGLRGVIPGMAIGSSVRPKSISLKLQATDEQQASAALLEKILDSETSPRALVVSSYVASQQVLRRVLTGLFLVVLGVVIGLGSQTMPVYADLPVAGDRASTAVANLPAGAKVLVVMDYEPSLAGEMEAIGGPLLDQMTQLKHPQLSFISTSPNGPALVDRLMSKTKISASGVEFRNLGFLPGGSAGVLGFVESPGEIMPASEVGRFSDYAMLVLMTDHAESGRVWIEQLYAQRQTPGRVDLALNNQSLLVVASAQAGPLLQPYLSSGQITGMVSGLSEAARYELVNNSRPGTARSYWDAFGVGMMMAVTLIVIGSLWSLFTGIRARRAEAEQG